MMIKYQISKGIARVLPVEVDRETDNSIWFTGNPRRRAKRSQYDNYYDTWKEAHGKLLSIANGKIKFCSARLNEAIWFAEKVVTLKP